MAGEDGTASSVLDEPGEQGPLSLMEADQAPEPQDWEPRAEVSDQAKELFKSLEEEPYRYGFFSLVRRFENLHPDRPRIGEAARPVDDVIRLGQEPSVIFEPATLSEFQPGKDGAPHRLTGYFVGLFGPNGPLPMHMTEYARERKRNHHDDTLIGFADIFHHRMLSLFYRAWACCEPTVSFDRKDNDTFSTFVGSFFGMGMPSLRDRDDLFDVGKLHFSGRLALQTKNPEGLMAIISDFFQVPVEIEEFIGEWLELPDNQLTRMGTAQPNALLGQSSTAGRRVWSCQYKFRLIFGPVNLSDYERLLPGGVSLRRLVAIVRKLCRRRAVLRCKSHSQARRGAAHAVGGRQPAGLDHLAFERGGRKRSWRPALKPPCTRGWVMILKGQRLEICNFSRLLRLRRSKV